MLKYCLRRKTRESNNGIIVLMMCLAFLYAVLSMSVQDAALVNFNRIRREYNVYGPGNTRSESNVGELHSGMEVQQTIPVVQCVDEISILFSTYARTNHGEVCITVTGEESGNVYLEKRLDASEITDNSYLHLEFDEKVSALEDRSIRVSIRSFCSEENAITVYASSEDTITDGNMYLNGEYQDSDLTLKTSGSTRYSDREIIQQAVYVVIAATAAGGLCLLAYWLLAKRFRFDFDFKCIVLWGILAGMAFVVECFIRGDGWFVPYRFSFILGILSVLLLLFRFRSVMFEKPEYLFLLIALFMGLRLAMLSYTCVVWDDEIHFSRALELCRSTGMKITYADAAIMEWKYRFIFSNSRNIEGILVDMRDLWMMGKTQISKSMDSNLTLMGKLAYVPAAIGLITGKILSLPYIDTFILGKIINVLVYTFAVYKAVEITPIGKRIMLVVALFPTNLLLSANYSYDAWTTGFTLLWIAMLLDEMVHLERIMTNQRLLSMLAVFVLSCSSKRIYCVLGLMFFLMPKEKAGTLMDKRKYYFGVCLTAVILLLSFTVPFLLDTSRQSDLRGGSDVNSGEQLKFILTHPVVYTGILLRHLLSYLSLESAESYMTSFGYLGKISHLPLLVLTTIVTVTDRSEADDRIVKPWRNRGIVYGCAFAAVCMISTALYISFTPVGLNQINGCQKRYLLPLVFPCLLFASTDWAPMKARPSRLNACVFIASAVIALATEWSCYLVSF